MFKPSKYQEKIFHFITHGVGNAVINAKAGSGKTTTAEKCLEYIPQDKSVLFIAFNKPIAEKLNNDCSHLENVKAMTYHSLGYSIIRENIKNVKINQYKYKTYFYDNIEELSDGLYGTLFSDEATDFKTNVLDLINLGRYDVCQNEKELKTVAEKYGIGLVGGEIDTVLKCLEWGKTHLDTIDYGDMLWIPYELNLSTWKKYDWIFIDEAQDSSIAQQNLIKKCFKRGGRFIALGDASQAINGWCGGDEEAFNNFIKQPNTTILNLPVSYRCSKSVIELAKTIVPDIEACATAVEGSVNYDTGYYSVKSGDMVLCRNTTPLLRLYNEYLERGIKCYIKGCDFGNKMITYIENTHNKEINSDLSKSGVMSALYLKVFETYNKLKSEHNLQDEEILNNEEFNNLYECVKSIEILSKGLENTEKLIDRIKVMFRDEVGEGVCLSTIHKAKGLESDNVYILCPSLIPSKFATTERELKAEDNLLYVAITRAKINLNFISESYFSSHKGYSNAESIIDDLVDKSNAIEKLSGINPLNAGYKRRKRKETSMKTVKTNIQVKKPQTKVGAVKFKNFLK